ncbi:L-seryl-tRNA(Sec) selenium transferase [Sulfitobacter marinus]|uniref:L-seryl-tRNA(Sec) selenium transferase n=1 Tax=Sulfitobacter marinus TaxID=394264 RepID=A0A1I6U6U8_9RHOB|nr:L-seryl-tRNA(Sec) selenium transferase [Sulfitobacter marinus]SFS97068.1 L-seryl-tRNA(Sec) selenium transferase [Sulfitobacter marinus]
MNDQLRQLPQIEAMLAYPTIGALVDAYSRDETVTALRLTLGNLRHTITKGDPVQLPDFAEDAFADSLRKVIKQERRMNLRAVVNATGIIIHTNLGRARLAPQAIDAMHDVGLNASNLELNLTTGKRGSRYDHAEALICELTGAEAALIVNNCAAAVVLGLMGTAMGRTVVASRGELIEIGGSFRLPDVIAQSGAILREVGATNKTRLSDYADAIDDNTAVLLKSHTSNFKIVGFTSAPDRRDLAKLAQDRNLILMEDLGSGVLFDLSPYGMTDEPVVADILKAGVDVVMFSGDKLLGGPQAGIIAGKADVIAKLRSHPLLRALRIDKLSLAALEATLRLYRAPHDPFDTIPVLKMLSEPLTDVQARADVLAGLLDGLVATSVMPSDAFVGGGSLPQQGLQSFAVSIAHSDMTADALADALRHAPVPVIGRIHQDQILLDMRTVTDAELPLVVDAIGQAHAK